MNYLCIMRKSEQTHLSQKALYDAYIKARYNGNSLLTHYEAIEVAISTPTHRFFTSTEEAYKEFCRFEKGLPFYAKSKLRREMYTTISVRARAERHRFNSARDAIEWVVCNEAPRFYITPYSAHVILWKYKSANKKRK